MATTVIVGNGIVGISTAYYLSLQDQNHTIHLVDPAPVLFENVASGNAAGFLAKNWFSPAAADLGELSFDLHAKLAEEFGGRDKWGWSESFGLFFDTSGKQELGQEWDWLTKGRSRSQVVDKSDLVGKPVEIPSWIGSSQALSLLSEQGTAAQIDPLRLCRFLLQECNSRPNVHVHHPALATISPKSSNQPTAAIRIQYQGSDKAVDVACDNLIVTSGPWATSVLSTLFPRLNQSSIPTITHLAGHSILYRSKSWPALGIDQYPCHAVFVDSPACEDSPEAISRVGGEIYFAGVNNPNTPLPKSPGSSAPLDPVSIDRLIEVAKKLCPDADMEIIRQSICFRPITLDGNPFIGRLRADSDELEGLNVWIGAGHGPWGISLSLGTGLVLSEMVLGLPTSADVSKLAPK